MLLSPAPIPLARRGPATLVAALLLAGGIAACADTRSAAPRPTPPGRPAPTWGTAARPPAATRPPAAPAPSVGAPRPTPAPADTAPVAPVPVAVPPPVAAPPVVTLAPPRGEPLDSLRRAYGLPAPAPVDTSGGGAWAARTLAAMPDSERVAQLVVASIPAGSPWAAVRTSMLALARRGVGGFLIPRAWAPDEVFRAATELQNAARVPLLLAADYERGVGRPGTSFTELPAAMAFGAAGDTLLAAAAGRLVAAESRAVGVNWLFGPVVDVNSNPDNPIINTRAFSERAGDVGRLAGAFVRGAEGAGLLTTLKHFPGHGDTSTDSHARLATVSASEARVEAVDLAPYRALFRSATPSAVMAAHVWATALDAERRPASISPAVLGRLRGDLAYDGLIVTDDVQMGALDGLTEGERAVRPVLAGADLVLTPRNARVATGALGRAVREGRLSRAALGGHVRRILAAKARAGLHRRAAPGLLAFNTLAASPAGRGFAEHVAARGATLLAAGPGVLPLRGRILLVQVANVRAAGTLAVGMDAFAAGLGATAERRVDGAPAVRDVLALRRLASGFDAVVVALHLRLVAGRGEAGLRDGQEALVRGLLEAGVPVAVVGFGNPYALGRFAPPGGALLALYDSAVPSAKAAAAVLRGRALAPGRLPVTAGPFAYGSGQRSQPF